MSLLAVQGKSLQRMIATLSAIAFLIQGYNQAMMNGFTTLPTFLAQIPEVDTVNTKGAQKAHNAKILGQFRPPNCILEALVDGSIGLVVAIFEAGSALGALACIFVGDRLGRPKTMLLAGIVCTIGVIIQASTYSLGQIIAGRTITGMFPSTQGCGFLESMKLMEKSRAWNRSLHRYRPNVCQRDNGAF